MKLIALFAFLAVMSFGVFGCTQSSVASAAQAAPAAGSESKPIALANNYYRFDQAHYENSLQEGKTIFLDFHADWCPICSREQPHIFAAFNELEDESVVGYQVHYKDGRTTQEDTEMAKKYGINLQHTKVIIDKNGKIVSKSLEAFTKEKVLSEIAKAG